MKNLIPKPVSVTPAEGSFNLSASTQICLDSSDGELLIIGTDLAEKLSATTGLQIPVNQGPGAAAAGCITLKANADDPALGGEGYQITTRPAGVEIAAPQPAGLFYGVQTLLQLLPLDPGPRNFPCGLIRDYPRFGWRGTMLDVARHFFDVEGLKGYIDLLAAYKLNRLHLHLSDDQGWRIEIKSWPNLAQHGGSTAINGDPGGYYTQGEYAEIVAHAASRYITIVPEIDMPGHTRAALSSYPELNCDGVAPELYTGGEVGHSSLCIDKEITYRFVDDVIREMAALTPGPYIHIGGDEAHATPKDDFNRFIARAGGIVRSHGKKGVFWEEAVQSDLPPGSVLQYWTNVKYAEIAAQKGLQLIISPAPHTYLDMKYTQDTPLGLAWAGFTDTEKAYDWDPAAQVAGLDVSSILGVEAPLWSETLVTMADVEYMAFPRLIGIAEVGWSPEKDRSWADFKSRLGVQGQRLAAQGVNFYRDPGVPWE